MKSDNIKEWVTLKTANYNEILELCGLTLEYSLFYCIVGGPGAGKTTAFKNFSEENKNVLYLKLDVTFEPKDLYIEILRLCGIQDYGYDLKSKHLAEKVARVLNERPGKSILIVDDAGRLKSADYVEHWQGVRDATQEKVGIILAGTQKFKKDFERWVAKGSKGIPELNDRIIDWIILKNPSKRELQAVATRNGITSAEDLEMLTKKCISYRSLKHQIYKLRIKQFSRIKELKSTGQKEKQTEIA
jgi:hypothetical protein